MPKPDIDRWTPEIKALLEDLAPEAELVCRLALQGEYLRLKGRPEWCERTKALMGRIRTSHAA